MDKDLQSQYRQMRKNRGPGYRPRTHHLDADGWARYTNRLFLETSPYLLQHAHNPVNWHPWGEDAFDRARKADMPILVSIGYATCHWCHVMEAESFEDEEIAETINSNFIAIKVDREERPDVDSIYMQALQAMGLGGGWPLNVWLTPELEPFFGGTYFPARDGDRPGATGFLTVLKSLKAYYDDNREKVTESAGAITAHLRSQSSAAAVGGLPDENTLHNAVDLFRKIYDPVNGGVQGAPKFPSSLPVRLLLRYFRRSGDRSVLDMATTTLTKMAAGGMYDHVAGGFHRYATDAAWQVPHFEKMLYDNALLVPAYLEGFQVTGDPRFKTVVRQVLDYGLKEMQTREGAFYSATDADSLDPAGNLNEGYFFTWTPAEVRALCDGPTAEAVITYYGMSDTGNFEGRNILHTPLAPEIAAERLGMDAGQLVRMISRARSVLWEARNERALPLRDEKVLAAWNGLMISALARAGFILDRADYTDAAERAAGFILGNMVVDGRLCRSWTDGRAGGTGFMEDYAFLAAACIDLYEATFDTAWLAQARELDRLAAGLFEDGRNGGFFTSSADRRNLIVREKSGHDNAIPSANSVAASNLLRLAAYTGDSRYRRRAEALFKVFSADMHRNPAAFSDMLLAVDAYLESPREVIVVRGEGDGDSGRDIMASVRSVFLPNRVIFYGQPGTAEQSAMPMPFLAGKEAIDGRPTAYICDQAGCHPPVFADEEVAGVIQSVSLFERYRL